MMNSFIHLHVHTEYSIVDGIIRIDDLVKQVASKGMPAVAITDHGNIFSLVKFYKAALSAGVKPIVGAEIWLENGRNEQKPYRLILLCQNDEGYKNLIDIISRAYLEGQNIVGGKPIVKRDWLTETKCRGLIALSAGIEGDIGQNLITDKLAQAKRHLTHWMSLFPNRFYLELQRVGHTPEEIYIARALELAAEYQVPVVATNNVHFMKPADFEAHEARVCIHEAWLLADPKRPQHYTEKQYLRSTLEMQELFADIPEAIENSIEIAKRCNLTLSLNKVFLPKFPVPEENLSLEDYLEKLAKQGLKERLKILFNESDQNFSEKQKKYEERLIAEIKIIQQMGFAGYFLIVADFIEWARNNNVPVGPGRGSGAGSLVAYALKITDLDPIKYDLLFERFLNPERISMPDFDIDFCMDGRDRVIEYVSQKYGRESVSQIITYGTMAARAVVRDVGRVLGHPYGFVDKLAKLIPFQLGMTLDQALENEEALRDRYRQEEEIRALIDLAKKLEGITRNVGKHAGGVVIAPSKLTDFTALYCEAGGENLVTQFDKYDVETIGLVKFDFLGLRTLTIIDWAMQTINQKRAEQNEKPIDISLIPTNDPATFSLLKSCQTTAVFQLESRGMKDLVKRLQPDCFEDIIALVALFRPGPLQSGMVDDFINRKHGHAEVAYPHEKLIPILRPTYGVILYQEQVMQIAQVLAGYSLGAADILRKAMSKKDPKEMAKQRKIFLKGAVANKVPEIRANFIFDLMEKFAGYGFNKSHSAAYAVLAYRTAWLKAHYPAEFMAAVLSSDMDNTDKLVRFIHECHLMKLNLSPPNINHSDYPFRVVDNKIVYGLGAVKGVGHAAVESILSARAEQGEFLDLFDFCKRVDLRKANRRVLEALIKSGAMDSFDVHRASLLASLDNAILAAEQCAHNQERGQHDLFGESFDLPEEHKPTYTTVNIWSDAERLRGEKETLGFYLTGHPIAQYEEELKHIVSSHIVDIQTTHNQMVVIAGVIGDLRSIQTKRGDRIAFMTLDDGTGHLEVSVFSDLYQEHRALLQKDQLLIIEGEISVDDYTGGFRARAKKILTMTQAREIYAKRLLLHVGKLSDAENFVEKLMETLKPYKGKCPICIAYQKQGAKALLPLGANWHINPSDELLELLKNTFLEINLEMCY